MLLVTKNLAELCTLVIDDVYGELPSRIFSAMLNRGRASVTQLVQYTSLTPRQLRHGLAVLLQYDLLFYQVGKGDAATVYDANPRAAYNLLRAGKVLKMVESLYGADARDVVQSLLALGHTGIADLKEAYKAKISKWEASRMRRTGPVTNGVHHGGSNGHATTDDSGGEAPMNEDDTDAAPPMAAEPEPAIRSLDHLNSVLCRLVMAEVLEVVTPASFKSFADQQYETRESIKATHFQDGVRGQRKVDEYEQLVAEQLYALRDESRKLKRTLDANGHQGRNKLRKLLNGDVSNGTHDDPRDPLLDPRTILRVNHEKCAVEFRNHRLVQAASAAIGEPTAQVYAALLRQLTDTIPRCRADPLVDVANGDLMRQRTAATVDIFDGLDPSVDVFAGIGRAPPDAISATTAERIERHAKVDALVVGGDRGGGGGGDGGAGSGDDDDFDPDDPDYDSEGEVYPPPMAAPPAPANGLTNGAASAIHAGGTNGSRVQFDDAAMAGGGGGGSSTGSGSSRETRMRQMRQHLLLLCDHQFGFVRHCERGTWTVDFEPLLRRLRAAELDNAIERKVGRSGLRLTRILRDRGKLDEKTLPTLALMKKSDVQNKMLEMQMQGFVDMQEVPRDTNRSANRTLFLWFCDPARALDTLLDNAYKTMVRCLRMRDVHRQANHEVLAFVQRPDVKGREKEALEKKYFDKYQTYCEVETKLLGQVMRLDRLVATLRDY